ncbi:MAG: amidohydrolase family protein [Candidatus Woesearchaeota archaeon]
MSIFIGNGMVFTNGRLERLNLVIDDRVISDLTTDRVTCERYIDARGKLILPGVICSHVLHDFSSAAENGVTTVLAAEDSLLNDHVNYGFHSDSLEMPAASVLMDICDPLKSGPSKLVSIRSDNFSTFFPILKNTKNRIYLRGMGTADLSLLRKYMKGKVFAELSLDALNSEDSWKSLERVDTLSADPGFFGLQFLLDSVNKKRLSLEKAVSLLSESPASIFGLVGKGFLRKGFDADLVLVDMFPSLQVANTRSHFNGLLLKGWPVMTIVNGKVAFEDKALFGHCGRPVSYRWDHLEEENESIEELSAEEPQPK